MSAKKKYDFEDLVDFSTEELEVADAIEEGYERKKMRKEYTKKMNKLWRLRRHNGKRRFPSMPKISFPVYYADPTLLDAYLYIEKWKMDGGESKYTDIYWQPPTVYMSGVGMVSQKDFERKVGKYEEELKKKYNY